MNKNGFFIVSNDTDYEFKILGDNLGSDFDSIIFVYSQKNDISELYTQWLLKLNKRLVVVPFEDYNKIEYASAVESLDLTRAVMIIKDLRFMLKRLDERLSMMQIKHSCLKKIIIDEVPFLEDMWKLYFPYSFFDKTLLGYSHSYAFEAAVRNYENDMSLPDPYDPVVLARKIKGSTFINYSKYFLFDVTVEEYKVTPEEQAEYDQLKNSLFESETSVKKIISSLHKFSSSLVFGHNLPLRLGAVYKWADLKSVALIKTNLKVDNFLYSEMCKLIERTNTLVRCLNGN